MKCITSYITLRIKKITQPHRKNKNRMINYYLLIITHFVSDWILQPRAVAKRKTNSMIWMLKHLLIIFVCTSICFMVINVPSWLAIFYTAIHGIQDRFIWSTYERIRGPYTKEFLAQNKYAEDYWWYFTIAVDQMMHLIVLFWICSL